VGNLFLVEREGPPGFGVPAVGLAAEVDPRSVGNTFGPNRPASGSVKSNINDWN
jgi:hypothetical protein